MPLAKRSLSLTEIQDLKKIVQSLASQVRNDRKIIMATQSFTTTLADNLDTLEESVHEDLRIIREGLLAGASDTTRKFENLGRAALDLDR